MVGPPPTAYPTSYTSYDYYLYKLVQLRLRLATSATFTFHLDSLITVLFLWRNLQQEVPLQGDWRIWYAETNQIN